MATGAVAEALAVTGEARAHARATRDALYLSEVLRVEGEARLGQSREDPDADACLAAALDVATRQGARLLALRAATSLVRARRMHGGATPAAARLRAILDGLAEGHDLADLRAARDLLTRGD